jgi:uncharacterized membrane protein
MEAEITIEKNRSISWTVSLVAAIVGLVDSAYLTWIKLADATISCSEIGDCEAVNTSRYSEISGIPIALLGVGAYFLILLLLSVEVRYPKQGPNSRLGIFGISLAGSLYSGYLTYLEIAVLKAICPFCVLSAVAIFVLLIVAVLRLRSDFAVT